MSCFERDGEINNWVTDIKLPAGNWKILGFTDEITEEQAKGILGAPESFHSILSSHNITNRQLVLISND